MPRFPILAALVCALAAGTCAPALGSAPMRIYTVAGTGAQGFSGDGGPAGLATFNGAGDIALAPGGGFFVGDALNARVRLVAPSGRISTAVGGGTSWDAVPATDAYLGTPYALAVLPDGTLAITVDSGVRLVSPAGAISSLHTPEGLINSARGMTVDAAGRLVVTDAYTNRVFRVGMDGSLVPIAGTGAKGFGGDRGSALAARLNAPADVAATPDGGFLIADSGNGRVRKVDSHGRISTVAGGGKVSSAPDGTAATRARLDGPTTVAVMPDGRFLLDDGYRVRAVAPSGRIRTVAGNGSDAASGDGGAARAAGLSGPGSVTPTPDGGFLLADGHSVRYVAPERGAWWLAVAAPVATGHSDGHGLQLVYRATQAASTTLDVFDGATRVEHASGDAGPGVNSLRVRHRFAPKPYSVLVTARSHSGQVAADMTALILGGRLTNRWALAIAGGDSGTRFVRRARLPVHAADSSPEWSVTSCHRFSPRRVDCRTDYSPDVGLAPYYCDSIDAIMLRPSGRVVTRGYDCPVRRGEPDFKRHPRWVGRAGAVDLRPLVSR